MIQLTWKAASRSIRDFMKCKLPDYEEVRGPILRDSVNCLQNGPPNVIFDQEIYNYYTVGVVRDPILRFASGMTTILANSPKDHQALSEQLKRINLLDLQMSMHPERLHVIPTQLSQECFASSFNSAPTWMEAFEAFSAHPTSSLKQRRLIWSFLNATQCGEQYFSFERGGSNHLSPATTFLRSRMVSNGSMVGRPNYDQLIHVESLPSELAQLNARLPLRAQNKYCPTPYRSEVLTKDLTCLKSQIVKLLADTPEMTRSICRIYRDDYAFYPLPRACSHNHLPPYNKKMESN